MLVLSFFTFISGFLTILAPCIWPLLPIILSASTQGGKKRPLGITLGITLSFAIFTLTISYIVRIFPFDVDSLRLFAVAVVALMGLTFVVPQLTKLLEGYVSKLTGRFGVKPGDQSSGFKGGLLTGLSLGIVWSPCAGPILASIATVAATRAVNIQVVILTLVYVAGVGIPLFLFATGGQKLFTKTRFLSGNLGKIQQLFGLIMLLTAMAIYTGYDRTLQATLLNAFPSYTNFLNDFESNDAILEQLDDIQGIEGDEGSLISKEDMSIVFTDPKTQLAVLPDLGEAPEIVGITNWLNSDPLTMEKLRGKVVLIDFWTYTCINCIRTLPHVTSWHEKYADDGLVILGVHSPEFEFEKDTENVAEAMEDYGIEYPVAQDNDFATWKNYKNRYWPAKYLIDAEGRIRYYHFGEGAYEETELSIQQLLGEITELEELSSEPMSDLTPKNRRTPELYLGSARMQNLQNNYEARYGAVEEYLFAGVPRKNYFAYSGRWEVMPEYSASVSGAELFLNFIGDKVFLVITSPEGGGEIEVFLNDELITAEDAGGDVVDGIVQLDENRLYELVDLTDGKSNGVLKLRLNTPGIRIFAFTFG